MTEKGLTAEENARGTVVLRLTESGRHSDGLFHIHAKKGACLKVVVFQNLDNTDNLNLNLITQADKEAQIDLLQFHLGGNKVTSLISQQADEQAAINTDLLCRTQGNQHYDFKILNVFRKKNGRGKMTVKGVALDQSTLGTHGCIRINRTGGGTDAHLTQDSLLLSRDATVKATPSLEIDTNDVKAAHGASISNLNEETLFYFMSRGIDRESARRILIHSFLTEPLSKIDDLPELKKEIETLL